MYGHVASRCYIEACSANVSAAKQQTLKGIKWTNKAEHEGIKHSAKSKRNSRGIYVYI